MLNGSDIARRGWNAPRSRCRPSRPIPPWSPAMRQASSKPVRSRSRWAKRKIRRWSRRQADSDGAPWGP